MSSPYKIVEPADADVAFLLRAAAREEAKSRTAAESKRQLAIKLEDRADRFVAIAKRLAAFIAGSAVRV